MTDFEFGTAPARSRTGGPRKRSDEQQKYDGLLRTLREMWVEAGEPTQSDKKPCAWLPIVSDEDYDATVKMLRSASVFTGLSLRLYDSIETDDGWKLPVSAEDKRDYKPRKKTADTGE